MRRIDINADLGESFGVYQLGDDEALLPHVTSANIACGFHAGDPQIMAHAVKAAVRHGVALGAHPGLPDLAGFGRRLLAITSGEAYNLVTYQIGALAAFAMRHGQGLSHVKPHGALYTLAEQNPAVADAIAMAVAEFDPGLILMGLSGGKLVASGLDKGLRVANEVFADRAYLPDGTLLPRSQPGAVIHDPALVTARMVHLMQEGTLTAVDGTTLTVAADTICLHGDSPNAPALARAVRQALEAEGIPIRRLDAP